MNGVRMGLVLAVAAILVLASTRLSLKAQEGKGAYQKRLLPRPEPSEGVPSRDEQRRTSVVDALERPFILPFAEPTRLDEVCQHLRRILRAPVVLDRAALDRQDVRPDDTIELELHDVRLKTGLKLLLDQVGLTYRVVPEDNLLVITDEQGAEDPFQRVLAELKTLHRDVHDLQDSVEDLRAILGVDELPRMRKPTIIEEMPEEPGAKPKNVPDTAPVPRPRTG